MSQRAFAISGRVLIACSDQLKALDYRQMLEPLAVDVTTTTSAGDALHLAQSSAPPALVLLDRQADAELLTAELRRHWPTVPVLQVRRGGPDSLGDGSEGLVDYMEAPVHPEWMRARVRIYLELWHHKSTIEAEAELGRSRDRLMRKLAHELRNPLNTMVGWSHLLQVGELSRPQIEKAAATITRNAHSVSALVGELLDASRVLTSNFEIATKPLELAPLVAAASEAVAEQARTANVALICELAGASAEISGDAQRLQQALTGVFGYALAVTPAGGTVTVTLGCSPTHAKLRVDAGANSEGASSSSAFKLALSKYVFEAHGGSLLLGGSESDARSTLHVELPLATETGWRQHSAAEQLVLAGVHALIVEDDPDGCEILEQVLCGLGATVTTAGNAHDALVALQKRRPDVLISDIGLPDEDGFALIRRVRETSAFAALPAVALTAYASKRDVAQALAAGFQAHIAKPVEPRELGAAVARVSGR